jgi:putative ABC transport system permease protein
MSHWFWPAFQREMRSSWKKLSLAALTLSLGMTALTALLLANSRLEAQSLRQADAILGGDAELSDVRPLPEKLLETINSSPLIARRTRVTSFVSMATLPQSNRPRLVEVLAIEDSYPLVPGMRVRPAFSFDQLKSGGILVDSSFAATHALSPVTEKDSKDFSEKNAQKILADRKAIRIGKKIFPIIGLVENDQMRDFASMSLGSRLYMAREIALRQRLISPQSRMRDRLLIQFPVSTAPESALGWLRNEINKIDSAKPTVRSKEDALNAAFKPARSLFLFFNAIGFSALILLGLGSAQGIHSYLKRKQSDAQILSNLGASKPLLALLFVGNVVVITGVSLAAGSWAGQLLFRHEIAPRLSQWFTGTAIDVSLTGSGLVAYKFAISTFLLTLSLILPGALAYLRQSQFNSSILDFRTPIDSLPKKILLGFFEVLENFPDLIWLFCALLLSFLISADAGFNLIMVLVLSAVYLTLRLSVTLFSRLGLSTALRLPLSFRIAGSEIGARPSQSSLTLLLFGLSVCLLVFMWDLRSNIANQITSATSGMQRPNVFVLDAPPDAMKSVQNILAGGSDPKNILSEKITRARLVSINNKSADEWVSQFEQGSEARARATRLFNREQNLTSRSEVSKNYGAEEIVEGKFWDKNTSKSAVNEVSVEVGLAKNLNLQTGDQLVFDIQGIPVKVKITSLRRVSWQSFRPNFFFVLHPSTLTDAPFSGLFAANLADNRQRADVLNNLFEKHPGVTALDATEIAGLVSRLLNSALDIVRFLTILFFAGALLNTVLSAWTSYSLRARNFSLYRCLGANNSLVLKSIFNEFLILGLTGSVVGTGASWLLSSMVQKTILTADDQLNLALLPSFAISSVVVVICCITAFVSGVLILKQAPFKVLRKPL